MHSVSWLATESFMNLRSVYLSTMNRPRMTRNNRVLRLLSWLLLFCENASSDDSCSLYLVASSNGWEVYAGSAFTKGQPILTDITEMVIPLLDFDRHWAAVKQSTSMNAISNLLQLAPRHQHGSTLAHTMADTVDLIQPGWKMLFGGLDERLVLTSAANVTWRADIPRNRSDPSVGSTTEFVAISQGWTARIDLVAGQRLSQSAASVEVAADGSIATEPRHVKPVEWLEDHGWCIARRDALQVSVEGVFTSQSYVPDEMIIPVPVLPLHRQHLQMLVVDDEGFVFWEGHQLLLSSCFGHRSSSVLLFPYGPIVNQIRGQGEPNVGLRWSNHMPRTDWGNLTVDKLLDQGDLESPGLVLEVYALREIQANEELVLDFGWQRQWQDHVNAWRPPFYGENYRSAAVWHDVVELPTDQDGRLLPSYVDLRCLVDIDALDRGADGWHQWKALSGSTLVALDDASSCRLLARDDSDSYRVDISGLHVKGVPRSAVFVVDRLYTSNQCLRRAFRHAKLLPESLLPDTWRDIEPNDDSQRCGVYTAESGIPNAGLGMYITKSTKKHDRLCHGDLVVQIDDWNRHNRLRRWRDKNFAPVVDYYDGPLNNYLWNGYATIGHVEAEEVWSVVPGPGSLANSHPGLVNAQLVHSELSSGLHRSRDPGAGASTSFHDVRFVATHDITVPSGMGYEVMVDYGRDWFLTRSELGLIPLEEDFEEADEVLDEFAALTDALSPHLANDLWDVILLMVPNATRFFSALPKKLSDVKLALKDGTARLSVPDTARSIEWLEANGRCVDNIKPGVSTIQQAGKGAFATRNIRSGQVIAPVPVVHVRRSRLDRFDSDDPDDKLSPVRQAGPPQQLLNYAFGHPDSSMLLFSYAPIVNYVNHNATTFNAKLQWTNRLPTHNASWFKRTPDDLCENEDHVGLVMELVATRDIRAGEEVFLDYGEQFERAWSEHVAQWKPDPSLARRRSAAEMNKHMEWIRTEEELRHWPYEDADVVTLCIVGRNARVIGAQTFEWRPSEDVYLDAANNIYPCEILGREGAFDREAAMSRLDSVKPMLLHYTARLDHDFGSRVYTMIPRRAIRFADAEYTSDQFLSNAFRHEAYLPDEMVPDAWRDTR